MAEIQREKERAELDAALERVKSRAGVASPRDTKAVAGEDELKEIAVCLSSDYEWVCAGLRCSYGSDCAKWKV